MIYEEISKLLKTVKEPSLRSATGSVFGCYHTGSNLKLPFTDLCECLLCVFFERLLKLPLMKKNAVWCEKFIPGADFLSRVGCFSFFQTVFFVLMREYFRFASSRVCFSLSGDDFSMRISKSKSPTGVKQIRRLGRLG